MFRLVSLITLLGACLTSPAAAQMPRADEKRTVDEETEYTSKVGYPGLVGNLLIPGPLLAAKPIENREQPIVLRILAIYAHGDDHRYDIEYVGLDPGVYDLTDYLQRDDGEPMNELQPISVRIETGLPPGQVEPNEISPRDTWFGSYYLATLVVGGVIWVLGLFAILFAGRYSYGRPTQEDKVVTVADRLKPLVDHAVAGDITVSQQAELERVLVAFWRKKLKLAHLPADRLRKELREHPEASVLLGQIDSWLHQPDADASVNVEDVLQPYQSLNYDEI